MRLTFPKMDARRRGEHRADVVDAEQGAVVGHVSSRKGSWTRGKRHAGRIISLFDKKYVGRFETHEECLAFAKGIEAAINDLAVPPPTADAITSAVASPRGGRHDGEGSDARRDGVVLSILPKVRG